MEGAGRREGELDTEGKELERVSGDPWAVTVAVKVEVVDVVEVAGFVNPARCNTACWPYCAGVRRIAGGRGDFMESGLLSIAEAAEEEAGLSGSSVPVVVVSSESSRSSCCVAASKNFRLNSM